MFPILLGDDSRASDDGREEGVSLASAADPDGDWARTFGLDEPGTVLISPAGKELWRAQGSVDPAALALALTDNAKAVEEGRVIWQQVRLGVAEGEPAPEFFLPFGGRRVSIRKLRGREFVVVFWTHWSEPSRAELRRQADLARQNPHGPLVVALHDGGSRDEALDAWKSTAPDAKLVIDLRGELAHSFGIRCWPTTVRIDAAGRVVDAEFGHRREPAANKQG